MAQFANGMIVSVDYANTISGTPVYVAIGAIVEGDISGVTTKTLDATAHGDTYNTYLAGLKEPGDATLKLHFETKNAQHQALITNQGGGPFAFKITFPKQIAGSTTPMSIASDVILEGPASIKGPHDGLFEMDVKFKFTGAPTVVAEA